jgi:CAAX protease family protein
VNNYETERQEAAQGPTKLGLTFAWGIVISIVYMFFVIGGRLVSGIPSDEKDYSATNVLYGSIIPLALAIAAIVLIARWRGADRTAFFDPPELKLRRPRWLWVMPLLILTAGVTGLIVAPWNEFSTGTLIMLVVSSVGIGVGEELSMRGYLLAGARSRFGEVGAWFSSTLVFALVHFSGLLTGTSFGNQIQQVFFAFLTGSSLYFCRRLWGSLLLPIVLHAQFDFGNFVSNGLGEGDKASIGQPTSDDVVQFVLLNFVVTIVALIVVFRHRRRPKSVEV